MSATPLTDACIERLLRPMPSQICSSRNRSSNKSCLSGIATQILATLGVSGTAITYLSSKAYTSGVSCYSAIGTSVGSELLSQYVKNWLGISSSNSTYRSELEWKDYIPFGNIGSLFQKNTKDMSLVSLIEPKFLQIEKTIFINPSSRQIDSDEAFIHSLRKEVDQIKAEETQTTVEALTQSISNLITEAGEHDIRAVCSNYEFWANATIATTVALGVLGLTTFLYKASKKTSS